MDILIKGMKMPSCCEECPFMKKVCDIYCTDKKTGVKTPYHYINSCSLTGSWFDPFSDDSPEPCPLIPLPVHGDLVQLDDALDCFSEDDIVARKALRKIPVVLERTT